MSTASKGRSAEWLVRDVLNEAGYIVYRARASKGHADLVAFDTLELLLVAVRKNRWPSPADRRDLMSHVVAEFMHGLVAKVQRGAVYFADPVTLDPIPYYGSGVIRVRGTWKRL